MAWQAHCLLAALVREMSGLPKAPFEYEKGQGSIEENVNGLYNDSKHADKLIRRGELPPNGTVTVWITNDGIRSRDNFVSFIELHLLLSRLVEHAHFMATIWPEKLLEQHAQRGSASSKSDCQEKT